MFCSVKKVFLETLQNSHETPALESLFSEAEACNFIKKETLVQVFSCEFCEFAKNTFSFRTPPMDAFVMRFDFEAGEILPSKRKWSYFKQEYF